MIFLIVYLWIGHALRSDRFLCNFVAKYSNLPCISHDKNKMPKRAFNFCGGDLIKDGIRYGQFVPRYAITKINKNSYLKNTKTVFNLAETKGYTRHKCLRGNRDDFAAQCLQNLLVVEPFATLLRNIQICLAFHTTKIKCPKGHLIFVAETKGLFCCRFTPLAHSRCSPAYFRLPFACGSNSFFGFESTSITQYKNAPQGALFYCGGDEGIRTLDTLASIPHFQCGALDQLCDVSELCGFNYSSLSDASGVSSSATGSPFSASSIKEFSNSASISRNIGSSLAISNEASSSIAVGASL